MTIVLQPILHSHSGIVQDQSQIAANTLLRSLILTKNKNKVHLRE